MKRLVTLGLLSVVGVMSCSPDETTPAAATIPVSGVPVSLAPNENVNALHQQFHGKFKVISSVSSEPVDVNLDGTISTDMIQEIAELELETRKKYNIQLRIYGPSQHSPKSTFSFLQWWPEQFIKTGPGKVWDGGEMLNYNPDYVVKYDFQGSYRSFSFSTDLKQMTINPNENENPFRWVRPESVTVEDSGRIRVVNKRRLYTRAGVKEVTITTVYERYTTA